MNQSNPTPLNITELSLNTHTEGILTVKSEPKSFKNGTKEYLDILSVDFNDCPINVRTFRYDSTSNDRLPYIKPGNTIYISGTYQKQPGSSDVMQIFSRVLNVLPDTALQQNTNKSSENQPQKTNQKDPGTFIQQDSFDYDDPRIYDEAGHFPDSFDDFLKEQNEYAGMYLIDTEYTESGNGNTEAVNPQNTEKNSMPDLQNKSADSEGGMKNKDSKNGEETDKTDKKSPAQFGPIGGKDQHKPILEILERGFKEENIKNPYKYQKGANIGDVLKKVNRMIAEGSEDRINGLGYFNGVFMVNVRKEKTRKGPYCLAVDVSDKTGSLTAKLYKPETKYTEEQMSAFQQKSKIFPFAYVSMQYNYFNGSFSPFADSIVFLEKDEFTIGEIIPHSERNPEEMYADLMRTAEDMKDAAFKEITIKALEANKVGLMYCPAALKVHEEYVSGLLVHVTRMLKIAKTVSDIYPEHLNKDLLFSGLILHDIAKLVEFEMNDYGIVDNYTKEGNLMGHLYIGAEYIHDLTNEINKEHNEALVDPEHELLLKHMILSHHGKREFGAVQLPAIPEADLLHMCDEMDAHMDGWNKEMDKLDPGQKSTEKAFFLQNVYPYRSELDTKNEG